MALRLDIVDAGVDWNGGVLPLTPLPDSSKGNEAKLMTEASAKNFRHCLLLLGSNNKRGN